MQDLPAGWEVRVKACLVAIIMIAVIFWFACSLPVPQGHQQATDKFSAEPMDRPVLQNRKAVWDARMYGSEYPKSYIDYAAWYVRLD